MFKYFFKLGVLIKIVRLKQYTKKIPIFGIKD